MRFAIIGAGAVGSLYGASLALAGFDVILVHRDVSTVRTIQKNGITLTGINGKTNRVRVPIRKGPVNLPGIEVVIVAVKAYDTLNVARSYRKMIPQDATVLSLQNGLGNVETLHSILK
ncbi:MAG TPA: 2-dehydropantoate 2-reductase N-terminal domain-containing protein, partial [Candidatus Bathyarchaeia archaeon]|nr:2-dehydropantoate 2-reductase N-terminal domain-containing protein [Candidatus Bathyarchaeia archaeon]